MFRLLIADDEDLVRRGLVALVEREASAVTTIDVAADGLEALQVARDTRPDIVLSDIRMPGLNGLDLIGRLRELSPPPRCIILSGYDEFDYARRAVGLGVADYLLKPVDPDELLALLDRLGAEITAEREEQHARMVAARLAVEQAMQRLLDGFDVDLRALAPHPPPAQAWGLLLVHPDQPGRPASGDLAAASRAHAPDAMLVEDAYGYLCLLLPLDDDDPTALAVTARELYEALHAADHSVAVTVARPCTEIRAVGERYQEAIEVADYHVAGACDGPLLCWEALPSHAERWPALPMTYRDAILDAITAGSEAAGARAAHAFMAYLQEHLPPGALRALWFEMVALVVHHVQQFGVRADTLLDAHHNLRTFLVGPASAEQRAAYLATLVGRAAHARAALQQDHVPRGAIAELRAYIESHPADDLTITTLAQRMHLNAKYLGELFKAATGESLGKFIIRTRMRRACHLLTHSPLKVYAVAEQVGYSDPKHFTTMFRSVIGVSPADYREEHRRAVTETPEVAPSCPD